MKTVSVIIPTYNHKSYLKLAIDSALGNTYENIEVIVIDDGSTDDTRSIAENLEGIIYHRQMNSGAHAAINKGIELASGDYIAILNDDDLFHPQHIQLGVDNLESTGNDLFVGTPRIFGSGPKLEIMENHIQHGSNQIFALGPAKALFKTNWSTSTSAYIFRKSLLSRIPGFRPFRMCHDLDFLLRVLFEARSSVGLSLQPSWDYRCHENNTGSSISMILQNAEILYSLGSIYSKIDSNNDYGSFLNLVGYGIDSHHVAFAYNSKPWSLEASTTIENAIAMWIRDFTRYVGSLDHLAIHAK
jgi:glycosyltransferase involved in cell wall biosynthesis